MLVKTKTELKGGLILDHIVCIIFKVTDNMPVFLGDCSPKKNNKIGHISYPKITNSDSYACEYSVNLGFRHGYVTLSPL